MKKYFLLLALILIFSISGCENSIRSKPAAQNDADETAETADKEENDDDDVQNDADNGQNNKDDNINDDDEVLPDPCEPDPCKKISHAGECKRFTFRTFVCECDKGWFWDGEKCISPCDVDPCKGISHATGACSATMSDQYLCECETGFFWNGENCVDPCENNNCGNIANAVDECIGKNAWSYDCKCTDSYFWYESACVKSPCASNSCGDDAHIECVAEDATNYRCRCENGYFSDGEKCVELPECSPTSPTPCKDSATGLVWSSLQYASLYNASCSHEGEFNDWHVASIGELRSLIIECPETMLGGSCGVNTQCSDSDCYTESCQSCDKRYGGQYSKFGEIDWLYSSSTDEMGFLWVLAFSSAAVTTSYCPVWMNSEPNYNCEPGSDFRCSRCDEGYFWHEDKCVRNPCVNKPCENIPVAYRNACTPETETAYRCVCADNYYWNGFKCILSPCAGNPCNSIPHAVSDRCRYENETTFICSCEDNYVWNGSECVLSKCADEPCKDIAHSYGSCTPLNEDEYYCSCEKSYDWGGESYDWNGKRCVSPCDSKPCEIPNSDGVCDVQDAETYVCGCKSSYYWDRVSKQCLNLCDDDPCGKDENSTGTCSSKSGPDYSCGCKENYVWSKALKKCVACSEGLCNFPLSDGTCTYNSSSYECGCIKDYFWDRNTYKCVNPCDNVSCESISHSTGVCKPSAVDTYSCECVENYYWDNFSKTCVNPCDAVSCGEYEHTTGKCSAQNHFRYICDCEEGYFWYGKNKGCDSVKPTFGSLCTGLRRCAQGQREDCLYLEYDYFKTNYFGTDLYYAELGKCAPHYFSIDSTVPGQEIVVDHNLGLEWQKNVSTAQYSWDDAVNYCDELNYGGYSDWRLPTPHETLTIIDNNSMTFFKTFFAVDTLDTLWTSHEESNISAWYSSPSRTYYTNRTTLFNVMCVRGEPLPKASFKTSTINGDEVATDTTTGLMWQKTWSKQSYNSVSYCEDLIYAGFSDWHLPNKHELVSIVDYGRYRPASTFPAMESGNSITATNDFITSTINVKDTESPFHVSFIFGEIISECGYMCPHFYVHCVRNE